MTLGEKSLRFDSGKSPLRLNRAILNRVAGVLAPLKGYSIYVYGYTDDSGQGAQPGTLRQSRPAVRAAWLRRESIRALSVQRFWQIQAACSRSNAKARAANRRVEIALFSATQVSIKPGDLESSDKTY